MKQLLLSLQDTRKLATKHGPVRSYDHFTVLFAELTFIVGAVALIAIGMYAAYVFCSTELGPGEGFLRAKIG